MSVLEFPSGRTMPYQTVAETRRDALMNYYSDERRKGVSPEIAHARAEAFADHRFGLLIQNIRTIMQEG